MRGNERCSCGSGLKFKRCCRNKGRDPETCHFCKRVESAEVKGEFVTLVSKSQDIPPKETEEHGWACADCISERTSKGGSAILLPMMLLAAGGWGKAGPRRRT
jgi:hypothetical protein